MAKKQKFGKFVLLEEIDSSGLGTEFRAAKLGATGLEKIVGLLRLSQELSSHADVAKALMEQTKAAAALQNPNVLKIYGIGKVDWAYYVSCEFIEGKSLKAILKRCRQEHFPFSTDHALLIASKVCTALEFAHGRRTEAGGRYFHGLLNPGAVLVSYEGEVRTRGFGYWPAHIREAGGVAAEDLLYLAPEQVAGGAGEPRSDIFAVGALLYEALTGQALFQNGRDTDVAAAVAQARLQSGAGDDDVLPKPLSDILLRALAHDPGARYAEVQELRKAIDTLLFSGDFTPTTFNLAFFMHSLFREDIERESKQLKEDKEASYLEYLTEEPRAARTAAATKSDTGEFAAPPPVAEAAAATVVSPPRAPAAPAAESHAAAAAPATPHSDAPSGVSPSAAAAGFTFHKDEKPKSRMPLIAGVALLLVVGGVAAWYLTRGGGGTSPTAPAASPSVDPEVAAREARIRDLEARLKTMEEERQKAEQAAADEAKRKLEAQAKAKGQTVDPAVLAKAQEEATKKARAEQERKAEEERKRIEAEKLLEEQRLEEQRRGEEARKAEEARKVEEARKAAEAASAAPTPPPATQPVIRPGTLVNLSDPGVTAPVVEKQPQVVYPPLALRQNVEGDVELNALIDEKGTVVDVQVVRGAGGRAGLNEAAIENVKRRKYRPASKDGIPVKVWVPVRVQFKLPR